ncbi:MAG TPA: hypothetical protein VFB58_13745 [Chloroflexota bacterium]|nr:hypothetical protein [Chloroflexota bacterium]
MRTTLDAVSINDQDKGSLPVSLYGPDGVTTIGQWNGGLFIYRNPVTATLQASAAQTAGGSSAAYGCGNLDELLLFLNVTAASGTTPQLNVFVDTSDDGGTTWYQLAQLGPANITAAGQYTLALGLGSTAGPFGNTIRIRWTVAGTTPSFTFAVKAVGK